MPGWIKNAVVWVAVAIKDAAVWVAVAIKKAIPWVAVVIAIGGVTAAVTAAVIGLTDLAASIVHLVQRVADAFTVVDGVLFVVAVVLVWWVIASLWATVNLGPVEISTFTFDGTLSPPINELTARFRERLDQVGLAPQPAVPSGAPRADVLQAVEAVAMTQSAFVAKLLDILPTPPRPAQFKVSGTLVGPAPPASPSTPPWVPVPPVSPRPCAVSVWVQPVGAGTSLVKTTDRHPDHAEALDVAANDVYRHIADALPDVFPPWTRWPSEEALDAYNSGCARRDVARALQAPPPWPALLDMHRAHMLAPANASAAMELANLEELMAAWVLAPDLDPDLVTATDLDTVAFLRASALRRYRTVIAAWPDLVEARFRASVAAIALARTWDGGISADTITVVARILDEPDQDLRPRLHAAAQEDIVEARRALKPLFTLVHAQRLRNPFEPRGRRRRALRHSVGISRECLWVEDLPEPAAAARRRTVALWLRSQLVHVWHLHVGVGSLNWQAYYNAACFDAIRLKRGWAGDVTQTQACALKHLAEAIRRSNGALVWRWVSSDEDLVYFRELDADEPARRRYDAIVERLAPGRSEDPPPTAPVPVPIVAGRWLAKLEIPPG